MEKTEDFELKATIDEQIKWIELRATTYDNKFIVRTITENLLAIKRWNESPAYHGKVDVEKAIEDLVAFIKIMWGHTGRPQEHLINNHTIQNAEAALGMLQAFKQERDGLGTIIETTRKIGKGRATIRPLTQEDVDGSKTEAMPPDPYNPIAEQFHEHSTVMKKFISGDGLSSIESAAEIMISALHAGGKLISCGNGGSFSDAQHFASELSGKYRGVRPAIAAMALTDGGAITCIGNDFGYSQIFKRQLEAIGRMNDVLLCLSTSGNSENVLVAAEYAKLLGIKVVSICGNSGGKLKEYSDVLIKVPHAGTADRIQEVTIIILHVLVGLIEEGVNVPVPKPLGVAPPKVSAS